jgi:sugar/nucleoside kinase (ribokinase family)
VWRALSDGTPDAFGRCLLDQLRADRVDISAVLALPGHTTGAAFIAYQASGGRDFVYHLRHAAAGQLRQPCWISRASRRCSMD